MIEFLKEDWYFVTSSKRISDFVISVLKDDELSPKESAVRLYYAVRDGIYYNPFKINLDFNTYTAENVLISKEGHCLDKAGLLITCLRSIGIPARLGLARVRNHIGTSKLESLLQTNVLVPHGYVELFISDSWIKCTPAFNKELCLKLNVSPLEWDGTSHSLFQDYDEDNQAKMEYLNDLGSYAEIPKEKILHWMKQEYPHMIDENDSWLAPEY